MAPEDIILFSYETAVNNEANPTKGELWNTPTSGNVHTPGAATYTGDDVNPRMVEAVLKGDKKFPGVKKVLESGPDDHVFVHFDDHGVPGGLMFGPKKDAQ
jgi:legumain